MKANEVGVRPGSARPRIYARGINYSIAPRCPCGGDDIELPVGAALGLQLDAVMDLAGLQAPAFVHVSGRLRELSASANRR